MYSKYSNEFKQNLRNEKKNKKTKNSKGIQNDKSWIFEKPKKIEKPKMESL